MELWNNCLDRVRFKIGELNFDRWVSSLAFSEQNGSYCVLASNDLVIDLIKSNGIWKVVENAWEEVAEQATSNSKLQLKLAKPENGNSNAGLGKVAQATIDIDSSTAISPKIEVIEEAIHSVRTDHTFKNFINLNSNQLACTVTQAISRGDCQYNPLFIHSSSGLGKTHLLHAIANGIKDSNPLRRSIYLQASDFVTEVVSAIRTRQMDKFRATYQAYDVLLIDDVQFFSGKEASLQQFFQLMNFFLDKNRQVVLSSEELPQNRIFPDDRIRSRLVSGLPIEIKMPSFEDRLLLIKQFANEKNIVIQEDVAAWIAVKAIVSIRELKSLLNPLQVRLNAGMVNKMTLGDVQSILGARLATSQNISPSFIIEHTASFYSLRPMDLCGKQRHKTVAHARHIAMNLMKELTNLSVVQIAKEFDRDHSTVLHALNKISKLREQSEQVERDFIKISNGITGRG